MPRGTAHTLTGTLRWTRLGYILVMSDGGQWRLDVGRKAAALVDREVVVGGTRSGFDLLDVHTIACSGLPPALSRSMRLRGLVQRLLR